MDTYSIEDTQLLNEDGVNTSNSSFRLQLVLVLDRSGSMALSGEINDVNNALRSIASFFSSEEVDPIALVAVEIAVISFGGDVRVHDLLSGGSATTTDDARSFVEARHFHAPSLSAGGDTPMGRAMREAIRLADDRNRKLAKAGFSSRKRPMIWLVSDGGATDPGWDSAAADAIEWQKKGLGIVRCIATGSDAESSAAVQALQKFTQAAVPRLVDARWGDFIKFVTRIATEQATEMNGGDSAPPTQPQETDFFKFG